MQTSLEWQQCLRTGENLQRGTRKLFWVINIFAIFTVVIVSQVYTYVGTCQIVHCTFVEFTLAIKPHEALKAASQVVLVVKNPPVNGGDIWVMGSIPGSGRSPVGGHGNPFQFSFLDNPMDRGAWQAIVHRVAKSWTWLRWLSTQ